MNPPLPSLNIKRPILTIHMKELNLVHYHFIKKSNQN